MLFFHTIYLQNVKRVTSTHLQVSLCHYSTVMPLKLSSLLWLNLHFLPRFFSLHSLEVIKSYARGHAMMKVADGLPSGAQILEHFGGHRKKKVFLYLPPGISLTANCILYKHYLWSISYVKWLCHTLNTNTKALTIKHTTKWQVQSKSVRRKISHEWVFLPTLLNTLQPLLFVLRNPRKFVQAIVIWSAIKFTFHFERNWLMTSSNFVEYISREIATDIMYFHKFPS